MFIFAFTINFQEVFMKFYSITICFILLVLFSTGFSQVIYHDDFEGTGNINWGPLFYLNQTGEWEENLSVVSNPFGSGNVGLVQDADTSYTGAALVGGDDFTFQKLAIEADVYCYADTSASTSRYTGIALMADTSLVPPDTINTRYVKLVADFDKNSGAGVRLRLYNSDLNLQTFQYTFDKKFYDSDVPGGLPFTSGWHRLRLEATTLNEDSVEYRAYFDGNLVGGGPVYDITYDTGSGIHHPYTSGTFGLYSFQQNAALAGYFDNVEVEESFTSIKNIQENIITGYQLKQNYPNPFNPTTQISFEIPFSSSVSLDIYNALGQRIRSLIKGSLPAGVHESIWNGKDEYGNEVPAGIYFYQLNAGKFQQTRKMLLVK
jgi:hypothetical protein